MLKVECYSSAEELARLRAPWRELVRACPEQSLFLSHEWATAWFRHFAGPARVWLLAVHEGSKLMAIAPMLITCETRGGLPVRVLQHWRNKHTSRTGFIIPERLDEVMDAIAAYWLRHAAEWDVLRLDDMPAHSPATAAVQAALQRRESTGLRLRRTARTKTIMRLPLTSTWEGYHAAQPRKFRKDLRQSARRLADAGSVEWIVETRPARIETTMSSLFELNDKAATQFSEGLATPADRQFQRDLAHLLCDGGERYSNHYVLLGGVPCAGLHTLIYERTCYGLLMYYDPLHAALAPGRYLMGQLIKWCFAEPDIDVMDFNGTSAFIDEWATCGEPLLQLTLSNARPYSRLLFALKDLKQRLQRPLPADIGVQQR